MKATQFGLALCEFFAQGNVRESMRRDAPVSFHNHCDDAAPLSKSIGVLTVFALHKASKPRPVTSVVVERAICTTASALGHPRMDLRYHSSV